jgi:hypothetical protein
MGSGRSQTVEMGEAGKEEKSRRGKQRGKEVERWKVERESGRREG